jgi:hypothetical protein
MKEKNQKSNVKSKWLTIRVNEEERTLVLENLKKIGYKNLSEYVRNCLLHQKIKVEATDTSAQNFADAVSKYTTQLKKIGQNFNQIVRYLQAKHSPDETKKLLADAKIQLENANKNSEYTLQIAKKTEQYYAKK